MIRILTQTKYDIICDIYADQQKKIEQLKKENEQLRKENSILNHAISSQQIDFPNSSIRSTDLYDPIDRLF